MPRTCGVITIVYGIPVPCPFGTVPRRGAIFFETVVWKPAALTGFESGQWAYEHNLTVRGAARSGTKPLCSPHGRNGFYVTRRAVLWESSFKRAAPYFDTDIEDRCDREDLTVGIARPENLDDGRPAGANVTGWISIDAVRGNPATGNLQLKSQSLLREGGGTCAVLNLSDTWRKLCIGRNVPETLEAVIVDSDTGPLAGTLLPTCLIWKWPPERGSDQGPSRIESCEVF